MATREERLIGYQLVAKANLSNGALDTADQSLRRENTAKLETFFPTPEEAIKDSAETCCKVIDVEGQRADEFLKRYGDVDQITVGLQMFNTERVMLDDDVAEWAIHKPNIRNVLALVDKLAELKANGDLLSLYQEKVEMRVDPRVHLPYDEGRITSFQNLLNHMAFELRGICAYRGDQRYATVDSIKAVAGGRILTAERAWPTVPQTPETLSMSSVLADTIAELPNCNNKAQLTALAQYIDDNVPQLPCLYRWWSYGN
jgi:hypothetical protein